MQRDERERQDEQVRRDKRCDGTIREQSVSARGGGERTWMVRPSPCSRSAWAPRGESPSSSSNARGQPGATGRRAVDDAWSRDRCRRPPRTLILPLSFVPLHSFVLPHPLIARCIRSSCCSSTSHGLMDNGPSLLRRETERAMSSEGGRAARGEAVMGRRSRLLSVTASVKIRPSKPTDAASVLSLSSSLVLSLSSHNNPPLHE